MQQVFRGHFWVNMNLWCCVITVELNTKLGCEPQDAPDNDEVPQPQQEEVRKGAVEASLPTRLVSSCWP